MIMQNVDNHIERLVMVGEDYNYDDDYNKGDIDDNDDSCDDDYGKDNNDDDHDDAGSGQRHGKASRGGGHGGAQFVLLHPIRSGEECANVGKTFGIFSLMVMFLSQGCR